jgi:2'-5' RNA ligase
MRHQCLTEMAEPGVAPDVMRSIAGHVSEQMRQYLVGARGFEPPTPCAQGRCATRLRYAPTILIIAIALRTTFAPLVRLFPNGVADPRTAAGACGTAQSHSPPYNWSFMNPLVYAVVAYVRSPVGIFVEELRRELHPAHTHADAHLTILPPRPLAGSEEEVLKVLTEICRAAVPFEVGLGDVETFIPVTPTVFLRVARGAYRMRELHDKLNIGGLKFQEPWPYMPHMTIAKMDTLEEVRKVVDIARQRWRDYKGGRSVRITSLTLVKGTGERWVDLAPVSFGGETSK